MSGHARLLAREVVYLYNDGTFDTADGDWNVSDDAPHLDFTGGRPHIKAAGTYGVTVNVEIVNLQPPNVDPTSPTGFDLPTDPDAVIVVNLQLPNGRASSLRFDAYASETRGQMTAASWFQPGSLSLTVTATHLMNPRYAAVTVQIQEAVAVGTTTKAEYPPLGAIHRNQVMQYR